MRRTTLLIIALFALLIAPGAFAVTWTDLPRTSTAFTASNDATFNVNAYYDYSGTFLDPGQTIYDLSVSVYGHLSSNGGAPPPAIYIALPVTIMSARVQSFPVVVLTKTATGPYVPVPAYAKTEGWVVSIYRVDQQPWPDGDVGIAFVNSFAVKPRTTSTGGPSL